VSNASDITKLEKKNIFINLLDSKELEIYDAVCNVYILEDIYVYIS